MLNITSDDNWKVLAKHLGFTKHEINKFSYTNDAFAFVVAKYQDRGGKRLLCRCNQEQETITPRFIMTTNSAIGFLSDNVSVC